ncbi:MAG TPA: thioredoxin family protein [Thermoanaerobaculia bacterium]|nr:thioredoxin family protein [Thermoanaerobaculia bacterium]HQN06056.1 thioredoxin family protein [Thermoanaerobaculia bacterium]HQP85124.1 thioredoxin family protein [Thermoanaerobaculia bacterium]
MKLALLPLAAALLAQPAPAQPGPGVAGAAQKQPGPGIAEAPAVRRPPSPPVYDEAADAKADVAAAVAKAKKEKKRVLVTLGANWCGWCRTLDRLFTKDEAVSAALAASYIPVKVDVGRMTKNLELAKGWGADPKTGVPLLVVLDGTGKAVKVQETGSLESGKRHDPEKVIAFLKANAGV